MSKNIIQHAKIETSGDLRQFLCNMIVGIKNGDLEIQKASQITKMAEQVTNSLYAEIKLQQMAIITGNASERIGNLKLGDASEVIDA